jgi:hypothetical protein
MTRRHLAPAALLAAAALALPATVPSPAQAKQIDALTICGADGCHAVERAIGQALHEVGGVALAAAPRAAQHYRLIMKMGDGHRTFGESRVIYVPSARAIGGDGSWSRIDAGSARKLADALAGRTPLPATALAKDVAAITTAGTSLPPEVTLPPASATKPATASAGGGVSWWLLGGGALALLATLAFIGNSQVRRR